MNAGAETLTQGISSAIGGDIGTAEEISFIGEGELLSAFPVTDFASAVIATAGLAISDLLAATWNKRPTLTIDRRLASLWFGMSIRPIGWKLPPVWDAFAGDYRTRDGWIKLHTNAPHHRAAAMRVIGQYPDRTAIADVVETWIATELETAIVGEGGCAAAMRSAAEWAVHDQGRAVASEPLAHRSMGNSAQFKDWSVTRERPLKGLRVLDLTRVLAGPVATRFLAAFGADVLRIDPLDWDEPALVQEVTLGKRCARLHLHSVEDRKMFEELLSKAHVLVHGYRPTVLDRLGFDAATRCALSPGLIDVSLDAYGWTGPWAARRGFDSLVQMSSGIAD
jgi:crotonobetainyl-CoA:carnitine CoA-transferase CaiB-like acyl-CoA transferase